MPPLPLALKVIVLRSRSIWFIGTAVSDSRHPWLIATSKQVCIHSGLVFSSVRILAISSSVISGFWEGGSRGMPRCSQGLLTA